METYDVIVIGSGPGGYVAAIRSAQLGKANCSNREIRNTGRNLLECRVYSIEGIARQF